MKKIVTISLFIFWAVVAAVLTAGLVFYQNQANQGLIATPPINDRQTNGQTELILNLAEIAKHNSTQDCWLLISNKIYNVTNYLTRHPGGVSAIAPYCGREATNAFNTKDKGSSHSNTAFNLLNDYFIGQLNQIFSSQPAKSISQQNKPTSDSNGGVVSGTNPNTNNSISSNLGNISLNTATVAKHNARSDCWLIINNRVYNVTTYISSHPGGVANIVNYCGQEASQAFATKGNQGNSHSSAANNLLANYYIGDLNQTIGQQQIQQNVQQTNSVPPPNSGEEDEFEDD